MKRGTQALTIGTLVTLASFGASYAASAFGSLSPSRLLYWQGWWLQTFLPCLNLGTPEKPMCEGTPLNLVVFLLGLPFGVILYSLIAFAILSAKRQARP